MNIDSKHNGPFGGSRRDKLDLVAAHPELQCPPTKSPKHLGPPENAGDHAHPIEKALANEFARAASSGPGNRSRYKVFQGKFDPQMAVLLHEAKFVFSPNGIGEQCYREYESLISGAYPLVDRSWYRGRAETCSSPRKVLHAASAD